MKGCHTSFIAIEGYAWWKWYLELLDDAYMRLADDVLKSVGFLCLKVKGAKEQLDIIGTAFFVSVLSEMFPETLAYLYLVTARHNITDAKKKF